MTEPSIVVFRQDLRVEDHEPLHAAAKLSGSVIPLFVFYESEPQLGEASRWWLAHSLAALAEKLRGLGSPLVIRVAEAYGTWEEAVATVARDLGAKNVFWHRGYEPVMQKQDTALRARLTADSVVPHLFNGATLWDPNDVATGSGTPYKVFTPFYRTCLKLDSPLKTRPSPKKLTAPKFTVLSLKLSDLPLNRRASWAAGIASAFEPGESGAQKALKHFCGKGLKTYIKSRDIPGDDDGVSRLSPHLHFGELSPRQVWESVAVAGKVADVFLRQLVWREFAIHSLFHFPSVVSKNLRPEFSRFQWRKTTVKDAGAEIEAWRRGKTGIPIVDAGMRELWRTGWMHNRVRMIVGSLLVKNLRIHWSEGAEWFWDTLVDADLANNSMGWQWVAGTGFDAAPYFRIFNPVTQAKRFDPDGKYIKQWVPELAALPLKDLFTPWNATPESLKNARVVLGRTYPKPIVDLDVSRKESLVAYKRMKLK